MKAQSYTDGNVRNTRRMTFETLCLAKLECCFSYEDQILAEVHPKRIAQWCHNRTKIRAAIRFFLDTALLLDAQSILFPLSFQLYCVFRGSLYAKWRSQLITERPSRRVLYSNIKIARDSCSKKHDWRTIHRSFVAGSLSFSRLVPDFIMYSPISRKVIAPAIGGTQFPQEKYVV